MNNMAYLNQISAQNRPVDQKTGLASLFSPKFLIFVGVSLAVFVFIIIVGSLLSGMSKRDAKLTEQLYYRISNLSATIEEYNPDIKSSSLRAMNNSLLSVFSNTNRELSPIMTDKFKLDIKKPKGELFEEETAFIEPINTSLFEANLNGLLDRTFTREFTLQIALILSLESEIHARTKNADLKTILEESSDSLTKLYDQFSNFSDKSV